MESTPLTSSADPEQSFDTKKSKRKREKLDDRLDDAAILRQRRHIAREALRLEDPERRQRAPEATQLHGAEKSREHIGHVLITAEADNRSGEVPHLQQPQERISLPPDTRIETLSRAELLILSGQIAVETSSLRNVYETHLIGEQALRRLVAEYLRGGDIQKALRHEILEHEIDFERDPALRDKSAISDLDEDSNQIIASGKEALNQLLQKAGAGISGSDEELEYDKAHASYREERGLGPHRRSPLDIAMAITIVLLIALVIALYFRHR
jgi:hypothetical protein